MLESDCNLKIQLHSIFVTCVLTQNFIEQGKEVPESHYLNFMFFSSVHCFI